MTTELQKERLAFIIKNLNTDTTTRGELNQLLAEVAEEDSAVDLADLEARIVAAENALLS